MLGRTTSDLGRSAATLALVGAVAFATSCRRDGDPTGPGPDPAKYPVEETFDRDSGGWTAVGDGILYYSPTGGNPGGYIFIIDEAKGDVFYFAAPSRFLGNVSGAFGRSLSFDLVWSETSSSDYKDDDDVVLEGAGMTLVASLPALPSTTWSSYSIALDVEGGWMHQGTDQPATGSEIKMVLESLQRLWIRGEFRFTPEQGGLDNVRLGART